MRPLKLAIFSLIVLCAALITASAQGAAPTYEVYALSYAIYPGFPVSGLIAGADKDRKVDLQMMIWLIKGPGGKNILDIILIDFLQPILRLVTDDLGKADDGIERRAQLMADTGKEL